MLAVTGQSGILRILVLRGAFVCLCITRIPCFCGACRCAGSCRADGAGPIGATPAWRHANAAAARRNGHPSRRSHTRHAQPPTRVATHGGRGTPPRHTHGNGSSSSCCSSSRCKRGYGDGCAARGDACSAAGYDAWCCGCCCCCDGHGGFGATTAWDDGDTRCGAYGCDAAPTNGSCSRASRCAADAWLGYVRALDLAGCWLLCCSSMQ
jgi:hypothetical protein